MTPFQSYSSSPTIPQRRNREIPQVDKILCCGTPVASDVHQTRFGGTEDEEHFTLIRSPSAATSDSEALASEMSDCPTPDPLIPSLPSSPRSPYSTLVSHMLPCPTPDQIVSPRSSGQVSVFKAPPIPERPVVSPRQKKKLTTEPQKPEEQKKKGSTIRRLRDRENADNVQQKKKKKSPTQIQALFFPDHTENIRTSNTGTATLSPLRKLKSLEVLEAEKQDNEIPQLSLASTKGKEKATQTTPRTPKTPKTSTKSRTPRTPRTPRTSTTSTPATTEKTSTEQDKRIFYRVVITQKDSVSSFPPELPYPPVFEASPSFRDLLICKLINSENAAAKATVFKKRRERARAIMLKGLVDDFL